MKTIFLLIFVSVICGCVTATNQSTSSADNTMNVNPNSTKSSNNAMSETDVSMSSIKIGKIEVSRGGIIDVEILNSSKKPMKLWQDSNSWGATSWRLLLLRKGHLETFFQNPDQMFTVNSPTFNEIPAGGRLKRKLDLNGGNWCGMGHCARHDERGFGGDKISFESNDVVIVVFDVPVTQEAREYGVWYGVIAAIGNVQ